jgi:tight adherence protein C
VNLPAYIYLAAIGVVASLFIMRWALVGNRGPSTAAARQNLGLAKNRSRTELVRPSRRIVRLVDRLPIVGINEAQQRRLAAAGLSWRSSSVGFFRLLSVVGSLLLGGLLGVATGSWKVLLIFLAGGVVLALVPDYVIRARADERQRKLEEHLPDILDRLKVTLEAGLGFDSALANVVHGRSGPAYDEFKRVLQDLQLGVPRDEALQAMSNRTTVTDLRIVLAAVLQSGKYGLPLVDVLRIQTEELRDKRWQRAQERALKVPVKMIFPLILCIMPTFFIVLVGPSIIGIARSF